jgi:hypothetical protein
MIRCIAGACLAVLAGLTATAQQFGGFPPSVRWKQIDTDTVRVVFEPSAQGQAQRVAALAHALAANGSPLGQRPGKITIVLHNRTTLANGYVGLGPWRSEFYLVPGSNIFQFGNLPWTDQLAVHEYRHVQQYNQFNRGVSRAAGVLFGEQGRALANALAVPDWFFEGDAVYAETALTPQGRGKTSFFFNEMTSLWRDGRDPDWMKLRNGSLKDQLPNHYPLGYLLVNYGYLKYGQDFWQKVTGDAVRFRGLVYPFQQAVKSYSGISYKTFRAEALQFYRHEISRKRDGQRTRETVTSYLFPQAIGADSLLYLKESYKTVPAFYIRDAAGEHKVALRSISSEDWIAYRNGTVAYTAYGTDPRWQLRDYSDLVLLDLATGREERITHGKKLFSPSFSPDGGTIVCVSINDSLAAELQFLDRKGVVQRSRRAPAGATFIHPQYIDDHTVMVGIRQPTAKISLHRLDLNTMKFEQLLPATFATVGFFHADKDRVYFTSSLNGRDDLYALNYENRSVEQLTNEGTGNYFPSTGGGMLTWSEFTSNGYRIRQRALDSLGGSTIPIGQWGVEQAPFEVAYADSALQVLSPAARSFETSKYRKGTGLLNFHSWRPAYSDPEFTATLYGNNLLNTLSSELYYRYNQNEASHTVGFSTAYGGLFPVLSAGVEHTFERTQKYLAGELTFRQTEARVGYSIPLNFTRGKTYKLLNVGSNLVLNHTAPTGLSKALLDPNTTTYFHHFISWSQVRPRARQHIYPRLGYAVAGAYRHRGEESQYQGNGSMSVYLPSPFPTHSLVLQAAFQEIDTARVRFFSNRFANARGYADYYNPRMWKVSANYHLPLLYPDKGIANIVYFMRVRGNLYYDDSRLFGNSKRTSVSLRSTGGELFFDTKWWNSLPVTFGVRYSYLLDADRVGASSPHLFEFVLPVTLIQ